MGKTIKHKKLNGMGAATLSVGLSIVILLFASYKLFPLFTMQSTYQEATYRNDYLQDVSRALVQYLEQKYTNTTVDDTITGSFGDDLVTTLQQKGYLTDNQNNVNRYQQYVNAVYAVYSEGLLSVHTYYRGGQPVKPRKLAFLKNYNLYLTDNDGIVPLQDMLNNDVSNKINSFGYDLGNTNHLAIEQSIRITLRQEESGIDEDVLQEAFEKYNTLAHNALRKNIAVYNISATATTNVNIPTCREDDTPTIKATLSDTPSSVYDYQIAITKETSLWTLDITYSEASTSTIFVPYDLTSGYIIVYTQCEEAS